MENRNKVLLYTNLAIQMGIIIGIGTYFGNYLDKSSQNQTPWWTLILSLSSVFLAFYQIITTLKNR
ncbi:MAG: AtpZ/AtpI family protein [Flavobacteriales bacterium]|nr:AtpZ/AtpI family protein [Flavobacteriales bacterium]